MWGYSDPFEDFFGRSQAQPRRQKPQPWNPYADLRRQHQPRYGDEEDEDDQDGYEEALRKEEENQRRAQEMKQKKFEEKNKKKQEYFRHQKQQEEEKRRLLEEALLRKQEEEKKLFEEKKLQQELQKQAEREKWRQYASQPDVQQKAALTMQKIWRARTVRGTKPLQNLRNLTKFEAQISSVVAKVAPELGKVSSVSSLLEKRKLLKVLLSFEEELTRLLINLDTISGRNMIVRERRKKMVELCQNTVEAIEPSRKSLANQVHELELSEKRNMEEVEQQKPIEQTPLPTPPVVSNPDPTPQSMETTTTFTDPETQILAVKSESKSAVSPHVEEMDYQASVSVTPEIKEQSINNNEVAEISAPASPTVQVASPVHLLDQSKEKRLIELEQEQIIDKKKIFDLSQSNIQMEMKLEQLIAELKAKSSLIDLQQHRIQELEQRLGL